MKPKPDAGIKEMLLQRLLSFGLVIGVGFLLLVSLLVSAALSALNRYIGTIVPRDRACCGRGSTRWSRSAW